ncbi:isoprenylcysteine alpha-carbonyl methylesterase ICME isoform X1 [Cucurbita moschata]|uniref:protein-S-isoprenylcysteine alpha-carbonyl methylesterase n=1 Tax=Cucurbita moschata TaxID=3662 RepID=A0A6J1GZT4_CUCMO|nr:isoprenylcysteine alpha-carbonyl methylesterase ICME isoform X1 [Cucurbita moschata]
MPSPQILPITQPPSSSPLTSRASDANSIMETSSTALDIMLLKEDDEQRTGVLVSPLFEDDKTIAYKPLLPRTSSYASSTSSSSSGSNTYKQKRRRVKSENFLSYLSGDGRHQTIDRDVENADADRAEKFLLTRFGLKLSKYIRVAFRWIARFLALGCYSLFLLPGFLQVGYYYFSSSQIRRSIPYGDKPRNKLDLYLPKHIDGPKPVVAFITGGAWIIGYKAWGCLLGQQLSERGIIVACIDYRNFPQGTMSDMIYDASQGISFLCNNIREFGGDPNRIYLMGQSAGAHIAACTLLEQAMKEVRKVESISWSVSQIKAYFGLSGGYNLLNLVDYFHSRGLYRSLFLSIMEGEQSLKRFSPELLILEEPNMGAAVSILPPIILFHGTADYSIPSDSSKTFADTLQSVGVKAETFFYEGKTHTDVFVQDPLRGGKDQMFEDLVAIIHADDAEALAKDAVAPPRRRLVPEFMLMLARSSIHCR